MHWGTDTPFSLGSTSCVSGCSDRASLKLSLKWKAVSAQYSPVSITGLPSLGIIRDFFLSFIFPSLLIISFTNQFSSVQSLSHVQLFVTPWTAATPGIYSNSCPSSWWCHPTISSSVVPFSSHLQSFPASVSFPMSQFCALGGQGIAFSASASVLPMNIQAWFPLGLPGLSSLQSQGLARVFSNTIVQEHRFFGVQLSL